MLKKLSFVLFVLTVTSFLLSCNKKAEEKEITLVMAEVNPPETIAGRMDQAFKEKV